MVGIRIVRRKDVGEKKERKEGRRNAPEEILLLNRRPCKHVILATIP